MFFLSKIYKNKTIDKNEYKDTLNDYFYKKILKEGENYFYLGNSSIKTLNKSKELFTTIEDGFIIFKNLFVLTLECILVLDLDLQFKFEYKLEEKYFCFEYDDYKIVLWNKNNILVLHIHVTGIVLKGKESKESHPTEFKPTELILNYPLTFSIKDSIYKIKWEGNFLNVESKNYKTFWNTLDCFLN